MARTVPGVDGVPLRATPSKPWTLTGQPGSPGVGIGRALHADPISSEMRPPQGGPPGDDDEAGRLRAALDAAAIDLEALGARTASLAGEEVGAIFAAQALFATDPGIVEPALAEIAAGATAAEAILSVTARHADALAAVDDDYFRERAADVRDVGRRVAAHIRGEKQPDLWHPDGQPAVVVATDLEPSAVATLRRELVAGIALGGGTATGHAAIVARALGIPMVLGLGSATTSIPHAARIAVDGTGGRVVIEPGAVDVMQLQDATERRQATTRPRPDPSDRTTAGSSVSVRVAANVGSPFEADAALSAGADGIGLVRTELLFLGRHTPPTVEEQRATYARIRAAMDGRPVVFRTLDVGGDKPAPWQTGPAESNPALGVRGVRLARRLPQTLDDQLTALVLAAGTAELRVMVPMIATREEFQSVRERLDTATERVEASSGARPASISLGVMIEVPSAAIMADTLAETAEFFSIGTNDLVQYTLAADRTNPELADLASALQPAIIRLIGGVVRAARTRGRHVGVCGEAAADPMVIPLLVGLGVDELSVTPSAIASVRSALLGLDPGTCAAIAHEALRAGSVAEVRALIDSVVS